MKYTVLWSPGAENQLADVWLEATDRQSVTAAQSRIDAELALAPLRKAIHLSEGLYCLRLAPLQVLFELSEDDRQAKVVAVRRWP